MRADGKNLSLTFSGIEVACVATTAVLDNEDAPAELVTFADVVAGNDKRWFFTVTGLPDYSPGTWWTLLWETPAYAQVAYRFKPYGNETPTPDEPHFIGWATPERKPGIGGDAGRAWTFDMRLNCTETPTRVTAGAAEDESAA